MYRIICESYNNYINDFEDKSSDNYRYNVMLPFKLITDIKLYEKEKELCTLNYKRAEDIIWYLGEAIDEYPRFKALLWTLESRGMTGQHFNVSSIEDLKEQARITNMFLKLVYWD